MITLKRNGREYQITEADQQRIKELVLANGGDVQKAIAQHFQEKFGEPLETPCEVPKMTYNLNV